MTAFQVVQNVPIVFKNLRALQVIVSIQMRARAGRPA